ncbi:hypothetical protein NBRC116493_17230 [Aurantivibrio infirmus]
MKKLIGLLVLFGVALPALGCDEACLKNRASATHNIEFPGYLTWKFCEDTKASFMEGDIPSLQNYRNKRLNIKHKNRMKNIQSFVEQRKEWLQECDKYMQLTDHGRIFKDSKTTGEVFESMDAVSKELASLIQGATYVSAEGGSDNEVVASKFDQLFKLVDDHKTMMMIKGQFVTN